MAFYLDDSQRQALNRRRASWAWRSEWPTWLVIVAIYSGWFGVANHARVLGMPVTVALLALFGAWYLSLQHELLHGHPTRSPLINSLIGFMPLAVWFPYRVYRELHLRHHDDPHLTRPGHDPESYFVSLAAWDRACPMLRALLTARNTFIGRLLLGPAFFARRDRERCIAQACAARFQRRTRMARPWRGTRRIDDMAGAQLRYCAVAVYCRRRLSGTGVEFGPLVSRASQRGCV
ncbi:hypothetical protein PBS_52670 [Paraburkholderia sp. 2C]